MFKILKSFYSTGPSTAQSTAQSTGPKKPPKQPLLKRVLSIRKVARVNSGGKIRTTSALVVIGDRNGHAGFGMGRADDLAGAVGKATEVAKKNMRYYLRYKAITLFS